MTLALAPLRDRPMASGGGGFVEVLLGLVVVAAATLAALVWRHPGDQEDDGEAQEDE